MTPQGEHRVGIDFPGDIEYIPDVRRFISNIIALRDFSRRFTFRTEIIIDELCNNAVKFGRLKVGEFISLSCRINDGEVVIEVFNPGADDKETGNLRRIIAESPDAQAAPDAPAGRGVRIIKILCTRIEVEDRNGTRVRVIKQKSVSDDM
jgi:anti-sigma regulatory factor (Ser/Thr protein kinase)